MHNNTSLDFGSTFLIKSFPSFFLFKGVIVFFAVMVLIGVTAFGFTNSELGTYFNSISYMLYIKFLPKVFLLFFLVVYNLKSGIQVSELPGNRFFYFLLMLLKIVFFTILFFFIKEYIGTAAQVAIESVRRGTDLSLLPFYKSVTVGKYGSVVAVNVPLFFICSIPAILITAYFQMVVSNMFTLLIYNVFRRKK